MSAIELKQDGHVWTIEINRPDKLNAMSPQMADDLYAHVVAINRSPEARVVILCGAGNRAFCAGSDISALDQYPTAWDFP